MRHVTFYDPATGLLHPNGISILVSDDSAVAKNTPDGYVAIDHPKDHRLDHLSQRVDLEKVRAEEDAAATAWAAEKEANRLTRTAGGDPGDDPPAPARVVASLRHVVDYQPPPPADDHEWDPTTKRWQLNPAAARKRAIANTARMQISRLERDVLPRALREHALGYEGAQRRLIDLDAQIAELRKSLS